MICCPPFPRSRLNRVSGEADKSCTVLLPSGSMVEAQKSLWRSRKNIVLSSHSWSFHKSLSEKKEEVLYCPPFHDRSSLALLRF